MPIREKLHQRQFESSAQEAILSLLFAAGHIRQALAEVCAVHGITHDQYNVLRILRGVHPNGHPRYEIAARLIERAPDVTRLLDRLERQGLVERTRSDEDRRLSLSRITADGLRLLEAMTPEILAVHERYAGNLTEVERQELVRLCDCLLT